MKDTTVEDEPEHDHDHDHDHDHNHTHAEPKKKAVKGEKKWRKAMSRIGLKPVHGITRVTIKKPKQILLYIDEP